MHVCVIGAGPTGLTAALELQRAGARVTLLERRSDMSNLSRAVGILVSSMEILTPSGVAAAIDAEAIRFSHVRFHHGARSVARLPLNFDDRTRIWGLPQDRAEHHLIDAFRAVGGIVRFGRPCTGLAQDAEGVTVETPEGPVRADNAIGCDGVHSIVRDQLGIAFPGCDLPGDWSIADVELADWPEPDAFQGFLLDDGHVLVVVPMAPQRYRVISSLPDALAACPVPMDVRRVNRTGTFTISVRQVPHYRLGRVLLAGDAAHCHSPVGGRGMNLGIADAADVAQRLMSGDLDGYGAARHADGAHVLRFSERARKSLQSTTPLVRPLVLTVLRLAALTPPLGRAVMRQFVSG